MWNPNDIREPRQGVFVGRRFCNGWPRVEETISLVRQEWERLRQDGPTSAELEAAKKNMIGAWPLKFTSTSRIADFLYFLQDPVAGRLFRKAGGYVQAVTMKMSAGCAALD